MTSKEHKVHRLGLGRIVVEGNLQPIVRFATLTLKDEDHDKQIMQVHVDGETLAQWDLGMLRERKLTGGEKFFTIDEQKMLQVTLPLFEEDGQKIASMKTIQLFILNIKDFNTAVNYLSKSAGMQHCHLNRALQNLRGVSAPKLAQPGQLRESSGTSNMGPPTVPPMGRLPRPQSQTSVYGPARYSPLQFVRKSQTTRPNTTLVPGAPSRHPSTLGTAVPIRGRSLSQGHRHWSSPLMGPLDPRRSFATGDFSQPRRLPSTGSGIGVVRETKPLYQYPIHHASMASHTPSYPVQYDAQRPPPSHHRVETDIGDILSAPYHNRFHGRPASQPGQISSSERRIVTTRTYPLEGRPSSQPSSKRPASRSPLFSDVGVPIRIQVPSLTNEPNYSSLHPKIRWEFTLHLLPSTKMWELCLHAASYIRREYRSTVDGRALAVQSMNGTLFENQDSLSDEMLNGGTLLLVERRLLGTAPPNPSILRGSYPDILHSDGRTEAENLDGSHPASSKNPCPDGIDEADRVPPPRRLPFPLPTAPAPPRSSSSITVAPSPLSERPDLMNTRARSRASKKKAQPESSQKRRTTASSRPVSSASGSELDSVSKTAEPSEPRTSARRPQTSLGIRRKRKAHSGDSGVSTVVPSVTGSPPSDIEVSTKELATTSCMGCRNKRRKCDRSKPACGPCLKDDRPCTYPDIPKIAATSPTSENAGKGPDLDIVTHPMVLRSQAVTPPLITPDALTQTSRPREFRDIGAQTQETEQVHKDVQMKDTGTSPCSLYTDASTETSPCSLYTEASTETDSCDDIWVPFSQCAQLVLWAGNRYEKQIQKAAEILRTTDHSRDDYQEKVAQAAVYALEFEKDLREKYEQDLKM